MMFKLTLIYPNTSNYMVYLKFNQQRNKVIYTETIRKLLQKENRVDT